MWTRTTPTGTLHFNPFVVKSVLESNCKLFSKNGTQQNFKLKPDPQIEKMIFHSLMQLYSAKQSTKTEVFTTSFIHVWTFENQTQVLYASPEVQVLSAFRRPETQIRYYNAHQRAGAVFDFKDNFQKTTTVVSVVNHQKTVNVEKNLKTE